MHISFWLKVRADNSLDDTRQEIEKFVEALQKWKDKEDNQHHEISIYVNQR